MNLKLLQQDVRDYLMEHLHDHAASFILKKHPFTDITSKQLTQQLVGLQKARAKFPHLFNNKKVIFPPKMNLEQTSSWSTALYKAGLYDGERMIDVTGGFGIDIAAFAKAYSKTTHVELNTSLQEIASQSFKAQELQTKSIAGDGIEFLTGSPHSYDLIYLDPSRKTAVNSKAILLEDYEPNVIHNLKLLLEKGKRVMIKTSPMLDLTAGFKQLKHVSAVHIVAVKNEVKELLWIVEKEECTPLIHCVNLETEQPQLNFKWNTTVLPSLSEPLTYLYEPNAAVMKSQAFGSICEQFELKKIDQDAHLFTSEKQINFPGRTFLIKAIKAYKPKEIKRSYGKSHRAVVTRNFRESVHQLRQKFQLKEHDTDYLFFTSIHGNQVVIEAQKV
ncbi:class I SAM-dependent methyltransferase [Nonlabens sp.]|uniref:class I SAM-dependent methyltransferase n=1 Tax=Nonlabens sp. TaxID=1888209 RepID=UPI003F69B714